MKISNRGFIIIDIIFLGLLAVVAVAVFTLTGRFADLLASHKGTLPESTQFFMPPQGYLVHSGFVAVGLLLVAWKRRFFQILLMIGYPGYFIAVMLLPIFRGGR